VECFVPDKLCCAVDPTTVEALLPEHAGLGATREYNSWGAARAALTAGYAPAADLRRGFK
jgi:hypothetical protein